MAGLTALSASTAKMAPKLPAARDLRFDLPDSVARDLQAEDKHDRCSRLLYNDETGGSSLAHIQNVLWNFRCSNFLKGV
jgi:hypothetical protein